VSKVSVRSGSPPPAAEDHPDWDVLFPPDPELMASAEGDVKGLAELQRAARERIDRGSGE
jgi:hypothetical protein